MAGVSPFEKFPLTYKLLGYWTLQDYVRLTAAFMSEEDRKASRMTVINAARLLSQAIKYRYEEQGIPLPFED